MQGHFYHMCLFNNLTCNFSGNSTSINNLQKQFIDNILNHRLSVVCRDNLQLQVCLVLIYVKIPVM